MMRSSVRDSSTVSPKACSAISPATTAEPWCVGRARDVTSIARVIALLPLLLVYASCASLNTFYNAEQAYEEGLRLRGGAEDSLSVAARTAFERAAEKSATVLERHGESKYADDALLLLGRSLYELGEFGDSARTFRQYLARFPDEDGAGPARLGLVRALRRRGDLNAAEVALTGLVGSDVAGVDEAEVLYEKARIELGLGEHREAVETFRTVLQKSPEFARDHNLMLEFADAELSAGEHAAALEAYAAFRDAALDPAIARTAALRIAQALGLAERHHEALATYDEILTAGAPDSVIAIVENERGHLFATLGRWEDAMEAYTRTAELMPGSVVASQATLQRGRLIWLQRGDRDQALDVLLDAFLHAPTSAYGDSARTEAREVARLLHYERLSEGGVSVAGIDDPIAARSTALYRLAEEVLEIEQDAGSAAEIFARVRREYDQSPWRPRAMLAEGLLAFRNGAPGTGATTLRALIDDYPDTPEADSARRELGFDVPDRPSDFYAPSPVLAELSSRLPAPADPMVTIVDDLDRYARRREPSTRDVDRPGLRAPGAVSREDPGVDPEPETPAAPGPIDAPEGIPE